MDEKEVSGRKRSENLYAGEIRELKQCGNYAKRGEREEGQETEQSEGNGLDRVRTTISRLLWYPKVPLALFVV